MYCGKSNDGVNGVNGFNGDGDGVNGDVNVDGNLAKMM